MKSKYLKAIIAILVWMTTSALLSSAPQNALDDGPILSPKSSISSLKIGLRYLENRSGDEILPQLMPMPLLDMDYFNYGEWAFYAKDYLSEQLKPHLNGHASSLSLKPLDLSSKTKPRILKTIDKDKALIRVEYHRPRELERLLQKLYFNLFQGPVILSVAYDPSNIPSGYEKFGNWYCFEGFTDPSVGGDGDVHVVYVDWSKVHTVTAFLDGGRIRLADGDKIYDVDHNALVAQANAIQIYPEFEKIFDGINNTNYLIQFDMNKPSNKASRTTGKVNRE